MEFKQKTQPRKSAQQLRSKETVKAIVQAAAEILSIEGVNGYNTNNIATRAGVSIGSLYQYFPNKDSISTVLFENFFNDQMNIVTGNLKEVSSWEKLEISVNQIIRELYEYRLSDKMINRPLALEISNGLFNQLMLQKKLELSRQVLKIITDNLNLIENDQNFALINLLIDSVDSMIFNLHEVDLDQNIEAKFSFISKMVLSGADCLDRQTVA